LPELDSDYGFLLDLNLLIYDISPFADEFLNELSGLEIPIPSATDSFLNRLWSDLNDQEKFSYSGYKTIELKLKKNSGVTSKEEFLRSESLNLTMVGSLADVTVNVDINQVSQDLGEERQYFKVEHQLFDLEFGNFTTDFSNLNLLNFSEQIKGAKGDLHLSDHNVSVIFSTPRGVTKKEMIFGNNSQGPYYLKYCPVVPNSEAIKLDGVLLEKNKDYNIEYSIGKVTFLKDIVRTEQQLIFTYETSNTKFLDSVNGFKYRFSGLENVDANLVYVKKNVTEEDQSGTKTKEVEIAALGTKYVNTDFNLESEVSFSNANLDVLDSNKKKSGPAVYLKNQNKLGELESSLYLTKLTNSFTPLTNSLHQSGDLLYGLSTAFLRENSLGLNFSYDHKEIKENDTPVYDQNLKLATKYWLFNFPIIASYKNRSYLEWADIMEKGTKYLEDKADLAAENNFFFGKVGAGLSYENKNYLNQISNSYLANIFGVNYSVKPFNDGYIAIESNLKNKKMYLGNLEQEQRLKISTQYDLLKNYQISGFYENIFFTDKPNSVLLNLKSDLNPFKELNFSLEADRESLNETLNKIATDLEKNEYNFRIKFNPIKNVKLDVNFRPKEKHIKNSNINIFNAHQNTYSLTLPAFNFGLLNYLCKEQIESTAQTTYYPQAVFLANSKKIDTHVFKWRYNLTKELQADLQYELLFSLYNDLISTNNPTYKTKDENSYITKLNLFYQLKDLSLEASIRDQIKKSCLPEVSNRREDQLDLLSKIYYIPNLIIEPKIGVIHTVALNERFISMRPEITLTYTIFNTSEINFHYSFLNEFRQMNNENTEKITLALKSEIAKHFLFDFQVSQENIFKTCEHNFELLTKLSFIL
jgi:hypothetical protein